MTDQKNLTFDVAVCERLKAAFTDIFLNHPEVKCLAASICWNGELNEANINHGVWLSADGPVQSPDGVIGSVYQTLRLLDEQMGRCGQLLAACHSWLFSLCCPRYNATTIWARIAFQLAKYGLCGFRWM